jgi:hypothetical protein
MPQYLVAIHHPDDFDPSVVTEAMERDIDVLNEEKSYGSLSHRKQGGIDEIYLFGIPRARQVRKHV